MRGITIAKTVYIGPSTLFNLGFRDGHPGRIFIGSGSHFQFAAVLDAYGGSISVGERVFIGPFVVMYGHGGIEIGDDCLLSMHVRILSSDHAVPDLQTRMRSRPDVLKQTRIGCDVWLGAGSTVLGGVTIGDGCVIGAGSVVKRDLPPGSVVVGVPARIIRTRKNTDPGTNTTPIAGKKA